MKTVFLFAGQGSQVAGMGKDLYEQYEAYRQVIDGAEPGFDLKKIMHEASLEEISQTQNTQPCMAAFAAGICEVLKEHGVTPDAACGLSLGEYGALYAAGVMDANTYIALTAFRGRVMMEAAKGCECSMSAVLGLEAEAVEAACEECQSEGYVTVANYNCPGQYVICGEEKAVCAAEKVLKEKGARRMVRLNVTGPFHTRYMQPAGEALKEYFANLSFEKPQIPIVMNVTGDFYQESEDLKELLVRQVQNSVRFEASLKKLLEAGAEEFVEIGPGSVLSGFLRKTAKAMGKTVSVYTIESAESLEKFLKSREEVHE